MLKRRVAALLIFLAGAGVGWFVYNSEATQSWPFKLGLDLSGGTQLVYRANLSAIPQADVVDSMEALRDTIERRVNLFGVSEPIVQTQKGGAFAGESEERLLVELPGITDTGEAIRLIGQTPVLEFRLMKEGVEPTGAEDENVNDFFEPAAITGKDLKSAQMQFNQGLAGPSQAVVLINFDGEGARIFAELTGKNVGRLFGIFLDGVPISVPVIQEAIPDGVAVISGNFTPEIARELARNLNYGALPVPIELISTQTISGTLGSEAIEKGIVAGLSGIGFVALFMILWYRLPGLIAVCALLIYIIVVLALFKLIPVVLTAAGIAAFILSIGMAVDANVLIFERMKEELRAGRSTAEAIQEGFSRAWPSIRDSNISSLITAVILFWFGTSLIKGFALVFAIGVLVSMLSAITVSRTFMLALGLDARGGVARFLFGSGTKI